MAVASESISPVARAPSSLRSESNYVGDVTKPNMEEFQAKLAVEREMIDVLFKKLNSLSARVLSAQSGHQAMARQREDIRLQVDACTNRIQELEAERDKLFSQIDETQRSERDMKLKVQTLKKSLGVQSEEEINSKIRDIERQIISSRLTVPEENKLINQIKQLRNSRPLVEQWAEMETTATSRSQASVVPLRMKFDEVREELRQCMQKRRGLLDTRRRLAEQHRTEIPPVRELVEERDDLRDQLAEHRRKEALLRHEMDVAMQGYQSFLAKLQREKQEFVMEERRRKQLDFERQTLQQRLENADDEEEKLTMTSGHRALIRLRNYITALVDKHNAASGSDPAEAAATEKVSEEPEKVSAVTRQPMEPQEGVLMVPKGERSDDVSPLMASRKKHGRKSRSANKALAWQQQPLTHDLLTLSDFTQLRIEPPRMPADAAACLHAIEEKLEVLHSRHEQSKAVVQKRRQEVLAKLQALDLKDKSRLLQSATAANGSAGHSGASSTVDTVQTTEEVGDNSVAAA